MDFNDLTDEQKERARACTTPEELAALSREEGHDLSDEELEAIAGGAWNDCGSYCKGDCRVPFGR